MIVTVSTETGVERFDIYSQAVTGPDFANHLKKLWTLNGSRPLAILMDKLSVHSSKDKVKPAYTELDIKQIINVPYSPEFNCIESCFSQVKRHYNRERLNALVNDREFDDEKEIKKALKVITKDLVTSCAAKSFHLLKRGLKI